MMVWIVGLIGSGYALFGGLRSVAFSDLLNGIGLLAGGLLITFFGLRLLGEGEGVVAGAEAIAARAHRSEAPSARVLVAVISGLPWIVERLQRPFTKQFARAGEIVTALTQA